MQLFHNHPCVCLFVCLFGFERGAPHPPTELLHLIPADADGESVQWMFATDNPLNGGLRSLLAAMGRGRALFDVTAFRFCRRHVVV
jgi:hypothetical protein